MPSPVLRPPHRRPPHERTRSAARRVLPVLLLATLTITLLSGCARVRTALAIQPNDTVNGEIVLATPAKSPDDTGPAVTLPRELKNDVDISSYRQDGYTGSVLRFSKLTFDEVALLSQSASAAGERAVLNLRRAGNRVLVTGTVDLTTVPVDRADFQLKIGFPGQVIDTNGDTESGTVSWKFTPGTVGDIRATVAYDDPNAPSVTGWTFVLMILVAGASAAVVVLARRTRNPPLDTSAR
ncbi:LppM family (lipo)protein [Pseudonocardia hispaniensis]|uniref:LppM family (Lipo)protein n=1 Tax=Pseudonocardia hispaniensis TaxID=904933 RepID=A0ABW1IY40_9PSEU